MAEKSSTSDAPSETATTGPEDDLFDEEWLTAETTGHRARNLLVGLLGAALVFFAGVTVQERFGEQSAASTAGFPGGGAGAPEIPEGFAGVFPGAAGQDPEAATADGGSGSDAAGSDAPAVIGTLRKVQGRVWEVRDLGGKTHRVRVSADTEITHTLRAGDDAIIPGASLTVEGSTNDAGLITATAVTIR